MFRPFFQSFWKYAEDDFCFCKWRTLSFYFLSDLKIEIFEIQKEIFKSSRIGCILVHTVSWPKMTWRLVRIGNQYTEPVYLKVVFRLWRVRSSKIRRSRSSGVIALEGWQRLGNEFWNPRAKDCIFCLLFFRYYLRNPWW